MVSGLVIVCTCQLLPEIVSVGPGPVNEQDKSSILDVEQSVTVLSLQYGWS